MNDKTKLCEFLVECGRRGLHVPRVITGGGARAEIRNHEIEPDWVYTIFMDGQRSALYLGPPTGPTLMLCDKVSEVLGEIVKHVESAAVV